MWNFQKYANLVILYNTKEIAYKSIIRYEV